eukprot:CAMPEP_0168514246 /NCGR_PEP_ID=MMETSP0405-20121227/3988_1 /TAXON_ID=498012 /ORGANISM="Trichosphaerium sp, Strain Am-I-7 wt" /LENGTH=256 /DNA_ID=CAMNT_0008533321 /DNA_START=207 /DNA_END=974 /DNA_ORIENTATION=-
MEQLKAEGAPPEVCYRWIDFHFEISAMYNKTRQSVTGVSPFEVTFGRPWDITPFGVLEGATTPKTVLEGVEEQSAYQDRLSSVVNVRQGQMAERMKSRFGDEVQYEPETIVFLARANTRKKRMPHESPYDRVGKIVSQGEDGMYLVEIAGEDGRREQFKDSKMHRAPLGHPFTPFRQLVTHSPGHTQDEDSSYGELVGASEDVNVPVKKRTRTVIRIKHKKKKAATKQAMTTEEIDAYDLDERLVDGSLWSVPIVQ